MATYYSGRPIPSFLRLTNTQEVNDKGDARQEVELQHKSAKLTYHLQSKEERENEDG